MKILLVEPDNILAAAIHRYFTDKKIEVVHHADYAAVLESSEHINFHEYDTFILTIGDDNRQGLDLLDYMRLVEIRRPAVFMSHSDEIALMASVFGHGAEDYLSVPFSLKELELRVMKSIRKAIPEDEIALPNDFVYVYSEQEVAHHHSYIDLTNKQRRLLYLLVTNKNNLVSYDMISDHVYDGELFRNNAVASHVRDIKRKITGIPIRAVKGLGYMFQVRPPCDETPAKSISEKL
jgi:DNA-binding response OmpR family regulator